MPLSAWFNTKGVSPFLYTCTVIGDYHSPTCSPAHCHPPATCAPANSLCSCLREGFIGYISFLASATGATHPSNNPDHTSMYRRHFGGEVHCYFKLNHCILQLLTNTEHFSPLHSSPVFYHGCQCAISNPHSRPLDSTQKAEVFCNQLPSCQLLHRKIGVQFLALIHIKGKQPFHRHTTERFFSKKNQAWKKNKHN